MNNNIDTFYNLLNESTISLLGYTFKEERLKDELVSKIPHYKVSEIDSSFDLKSFVRDLKIKSILEDKYLNEIKYIVLDVNVLRNNIRLNKIGVSQLNKTRIDISISSELGSLINKVGLQFYETGYKLLLTSPLNKSISNNKDIFNFIGGNKSIYMSDVVFTIESDKINILKNRHSEEKQISIKGLKEYNYEYSK
jgi:hypothetical protein